jgi:hypothetical protein
MAYDVETTFRYLLIIVARQRCFSDVARVSVYGVCVCARV